MSSKYKVVGVHLANLNQGPAWNLIATIMLPSETTTTYYPDNPENIDSMTIAALKDYVLSEFQKKNDI